MTIRNSNDEWQDDYADQNKKQNFGNVTSTRSSDRNSGNSSRSSGNSNRSSGNSHGGFGKSMRK